MLPARYERVRVVRALVASSALSVAAYAISARAQSQATPSSQTPSAQTQTTAQPGQSTQSAQSPELGKRDISAILWERPHTLAILDGGVIVLPDAAISPGNRGGNTPLLGSIGQGDATIQTGIHLLYRTGDFMVGANAFFAPKPTSDNEYTNALDPTLQRTHSRSYLFMGGEGRYVPLRYRWFEVWVGLVAGVVIIADRYITQSGEAVPEVFGQKDVTVRTEGFALGLQLGVDYMITDNWVVGLGLRADRWILPSASSDRTTDPACTSLRDCPTLLGGATAFIGGITIGYRIPL